MFDVFIKLLDYLNVGDINYKFIFNGQIFLLTNDILTGQNNYE